MTTATVDLSRSHLPRLRGLPWVTWRQHRVAMAGVVVLLGGFGVLMLANGLAMHSAYSRLGLTSCGNLDGPSCAVPLGVFEREYDSWAQFLPRFLMFIPAAIGVFVGGPLVARELESGTFRFAWTQGRNRVQWLVVKLALLGGALTALALAFSAVFSWWYGPFESLMGRMSSGQAYEAAGVVFAARTLFAFSLGALLGTLIRRTVPAMAATAAIWLAVAWPSVTYLRPHIAQAVNVPENSNLVTRDGWIISSWIQDASGHHLDAGRLIPQARANGVNSPDAFQAWMSQHHYSSWVSYQPDNRFWHFQAIEASAYTVLALVLAALTVWWTRRRAT